MSIRFQCPHCNSIRAANERMAGKKIRCPVCSGNVQLPTLEEIAAAEREAQQLQTLQSQLGTIESNANRANYSSPAPQHGTNSAATEENAEEAMVFEKKKNRDDSEMDMTPSCYPVAKNVKSPANKI